MMISFTYLTFACVVGVISEDPNDYYLGGQLHMRKNSEGKPSVECLRTSTSSLSDDFCTSTKLEVQLDGGSFEIRSASVGLCLNQVTYQLIRLVDEFITFSDASRSPRYRLTSPYILPGDIRLVPRDGNTIWNISPFYHGLFPLPIFSSCPVLLKVVDSENDIFKCYNYDKSCTPGYCDAQDGDKFYVLFENCFLLLPPGSTRTRVGISIEDTEDSNGLPVGGQTLLELSLDIRSGDSGCKGVGSFSNLNPGSHLLVPNEKIILYASTKLTSVLIGQSDFQCAIQRNPDDILVTVSEVMGFDSTVVDNADPTGKGSGVWQKFEIAMELKSGTAFTGAFVLCCFFHFEDFGAIHTSEAQYITLDSEIQTTTETTPTSATATSSNLVLETFKHFGLEIDQDEDIQFELTFSHDIKIGLDHPCITISSNIVKIFPNREGNRYKIEKNKVTIILPLESKDDIRTHEVVFPARLFLCKTDDERVIPSQEIRRSFPEIAAQVLRNERRNTINGIESIPSENEVSDVRNPIINRQIQLFNSIHQQNIQQEQTKQEQPKSEQRSINKFDREILTATNAVQSSFPIHPFRKRQFQKTLKRGFRQSNVRNSIVRQEVNIEGRGFERTIQGRGEEHVAGNSRPGFGRFGEEITERQSINRVSGRERQINQVFGRERQVNHLFGEEQQVNRVFGTEQQINRVFE